MGYGHIMQMNPTDLAHRAAQVVDTISEHGASALDTAGRVAGDVGEVIVDAVDRVGRALPSGLPGRSKRRWPIAPLGLLALIVLGAVLMRRRRRADGAVQTAAGDHRSEHAANGSSRDGSRERTEARAAGLA